jgi:hypothetical protein
MNLPTDTQKTNRDAAVALMYRLIELEVTQSAMIAVLDTCRDVDLHRPLIWRPLVQSHRTDERLREAVRGRYDAIERAMLASTGDCPEALSLLSSMLPNLALER